MQTPRISLKEYIISHNYRKQVESHSRHKNKPQYMKASVIDTQGSHKLINQSALANKVQQIKCYARQVITQDIFFAKLQNMLSQLLRLFIKQINLERTNNNITTQIFKMSAEKISKSKTQTLSQNPTIKNRIQSLFNTAKNCHEEQNHQSHETSLQKRVQSVKNSRRETTIIDKKQEINKMQNVIKQTPKNPQKKLHEPPIIKRSQKSSRAEKTEKLLYSSAIFKDKGVSTETNRTQKTTSVHQNILTQKQKQQNIENKNINDYIRKFSYIPLNSQQTNIATKLTAGKMSSQIRQIK